MFLSNTSGTPGYCAVQGSKGRIIIIDNEITEGIIINRKYVIAHSTNIVLRKPNGVHPAEILNQLGG